MGISDEYKILIKNLHDSARNSLWDFFNWHFEYSLWTDNVDFVHVCYIQCDSLSVASSTRNQHASPPEGNAMPAGPLSDSEEILCCCGILIGQLSC